MQAVKISAITLHGRSRQQRYAKAADWDYIGTCARDPSTTIPFIGNGDVFSYDDLDSALRADCGA